MNPIEVLRGSKSRGHFLAMHDFGAWAEVDIWVEYIHVTNKVIVRRSEYFCSLSAEAKQHKRF